MDYLLTFTFIHCWLELRNIPCWANMHMESMKAMLMKQKSCDVATSKVIDISEVKLVETLIVPNSMWKIIHKWWKTKNFAPL